MSRRELATRIGINVSNLYRAETGQSVLDDDNRLKAAAALGIQVSDVWAYPDPADGAA